MDLLVLGLGNPGDKYKNSRHNVGFDTVELLAERFDLKFKKKRFPVTYEVAKTVVSGSTLVLVKPLTFMNTSGTVLPVLFRRYNMNVDNLVVIVDNMDLQPGQCRLKKKGSHAGHNGLKSIIQHTKTGDFKRLYIGVGHPGKNGDVIKHVLTPPSKKDWPDYLASFRTASDGIVNMLDKDLDRVINEVNSSRAI